MTLEEIQDLSDNELRIKVAKLCGWTTYTTKHGTAWFYGGRAWPIDDVPDYCNDLRAMHEAVNLLRRMDGPQWFDFPVGLEKICGSIGNCINATARQRAEAFVLTMEKA